MIVDGNTKQARRVNEAQASLFNMRADTKIAFPFRRRWQVSISLPAWPSNRPKSQVRQTRAAL
jgi:hypothetical protein